MSRVRRQGPALAAWRQATAEDATALRDLERVANLAALQHVFPPQAFPFPDEAVLERWRATLAEPSVTVEVLEGPRLLAFAAYDGTTLRHLAVHPDAWGAGLARAGVDRAVAGIAASGVERALLWCLEANIRALGLYRHLGWRQTGKRRPAEWPPYPVEVQLDLRIRPSRHDRGPSVTPRIARKS